MRTIKTVYLSQLEEIEILWPGDVRVLAEFILRSYDARDQKINLQNCGARQRSRPTLHGLASHFARLTNISAYQVEQAFQAHGLNLETTVEFDLKPTD